MLIVVVLGAWFAVWAIRRADSRDSGLDATEGASPTS